MAVRHQATSNCFLGVQVQHARRRCCCCSAMRPCTSVLRMLHPESGTGRESACDACRGRRQTTTAFHLQFISTALSSPRLYTLKTHTLNKTLLRRRTPRRSASLLQATTRAAPRSVGGSRAPAALRRRRTPQRSQRLLPHERRRNLER